MVLSYQATQTDENGSRGRFQNSQFGACHSRPACSRCHLDDLASELVAVGNRNNGAPLNSIEGSYPRYKNYWRAHIRRMLIKRGALRRYETPYFFVLFNSPKAGCFQSPDFYTSPENQQSRSPYHSAKRGSRTLEATRLPQGTL